MHSNASTLIYMLIGQIACHGVEMKLRYHIRPNARMKQSPKTPEFFFLLYQVTQFVAINSTKVHQDGWEPLRDGTLCCSVIGPLRSVDWGKRWGNASFAVAYSTCRLWVSQRSVLCDVMGQERVFSSVKRVYG